MNAESPPTVGSNETRPVETEVSRLRGDSPAEALESCRLLRIADPEPTTRAGDFPDPVTWGGCAGATPSSRGL